MVKGGGTFGIEKVARLAPIERDPVAVVAATTVDYTQQVDYHMSMMNRGGTNSEYIRGAPRGHAYGSLSATLRPMHVGNDLIAPSALSQSVGGVGGHEILPIGGHRNAPLVAAVSPHAWPRFLPTVLS